jgi:hypothetical protein
VNKHDYGVTFGGTGTPVVNMLSGSNSRRDTGLRDNNDAGAMHIAATDGTTDKAVGGGVDDGVGTTATGSNASSKSLAIPNPFAPQSSSAWIRATFDSWATDGVNHNYDAVAGGSNYHYLGWVVVPSGLTANVVGTGLLDSQKLSRMRLAR